jgi:alcohol dehydrogenase class IV
LKEKNIDSVLIVTDKGIINANIIAPLLEILKKDGIRFEIFSEVVPDPPEKLIFNGLEILKNNHLNSVIGLGGGSSMDTAKVISLLAETDIELDNIYGINFMEGRRLPLFLIPTTSGTGSEVTPYAVLTKGKAKCTVISPIIIPDIAILDPQLTINLPPNITASTGIDAIVHAIEAYTSKNKKNIISDMFAKQALRLLIHNIETAVHNGNDLNARYNMLLGACLAGMAFTNAPVAAIHAFAYPLGGIFHISHGLSNSLMLPHVMEFNKDIAINEYYELAIEVYPNWQTNKDSKDVIVEKFIANISNLIKKLGIPVKLSEVGIKKEDLKLLTDEVVKLTRLFNNNPKAITYKDAFKIYENAF